MNKLTIRQQYKMAALTGVLANGKGSVGEIIHNANFIGDIADVMIKEDEEHQKAKAQKRLTKYKTILTKDK